MRCSQKGKRAFSDRGEAMPEAIACAWLARNVAQEGGCSLIGVFLLDS